MCVWDAAALIGDPNSTALKSLTEQRRDLRRQRDEINRQIRNEEKKRSRVIERARSLSNGRAVNFAAVVCVDISATSNRLATGRRHRFRFEIDRQLIAFILFGFPEQLINHFLI